MVSMNRRNYYYKTNIASMYFWTPDCCFKMDLKIVNVYFNKSTFCSNAFIQGCCIQHRSNLCCMSTNDLVSLLLSTHTHAPPLMFSIIQSFCVDSYDLSIYFTLVSLDGSSSLIFAEILAQECCSSLTPGGTSCIFSSHPGNAPLWFLTKINLNRALRQCTSH